MTAQALPYQGAYIPGPMVTTTMQCPGRWICKKTWVPREEVRKEKVCHYVAKEQCKVENYTVCKCVPYTVSRCVPRTESGSGSPNFSFRSGLLSNRSCCAGPPLWNR